ncbi:MAG: TM2 domain-containing protein [Kiritimatiellae bacterium]|nr:TM2 domain-containing protein [Kiritimatiellia bacterium]
MFCKNCGVEISDCAVICPKCGESVITRNYRAVYEAKEPAVAWLLWFFLGGLGVHCFYLERGGRGVLYLALLIILSWPTKGISLLVALLLWLYDATQINKWLREVNCNRI